MIPFPVSKVTTDEHLPKKRIALVRDGSVESVITVPADWPNVENAWSPPDGCEVVESEITAVGDQWDGETFWRECEVEIDKQVYRVACDVSQIEGRERDDAVAYIESRVAELKPEPVRTVQNRQSKIAALEERLQALESARQVRS